MLGMGTFIKAGALAFFLSVSCVAPAFSVPLDLSGPVKDGKAAYDKNDYATALRLFRPLADKGDALAQYSLGIMYDNGEGVTQDQAEAVKGTKWPGR